jgi:hypothetical protein
MRSLDITGNGVNSYDINAFIGIFDLFERAITENRLDISIPTQINGLKAIKQNRMTKPQSKELYTHLYDYLEHLKNDFNSSLRKTCNCLKEVGATLIEFSLFLKDKVLDIPARDRYSLTLIIIILCNYVAPLGELGHFEDIMSIACSLQEEVRHDEANIWISSTYYNYAGMLISSNSSEQASRLLDTSIEYLKRAPSKKDYAIQIMRRYDVIASCNFNLKNFEVSEHYHIYLQECKRYIIEHIKLVLKINGTIEALKSLVEKYIKAQISSGSIEYRSILSIAIELKSSALKDTLWMELDCLRAFSSKYNTTMFQKTVLEQALVVDPNDSVLILEYGWELINDKGRIRAHTNQLFHT